MLPSATNRFPADALEQIRMIAPKQITLLEMRCRFFISFLLLFYRSICTARNVAGCYAGSFGNTADHADTGLLTGGLVQQSLAENASTELTRLQCKDRFGASPKPKREPRVF